MKKSQVLRCGGKRFNRQRKYLIVTLTMGRVKGGTWQEATFHGRLDKGQKPLSIKVKTLNINPLFMIFDQPPGIKLGINVFLNRTVLS